MRNRRTRLITALVGIVVSAMFVAACGEEDNGGGGDEGGDIVIGYAAAETGELAPYDSPDGVACRVEQINEDGGILGRQIELVTRDMKSDPATATTVAQELVDEGAVAILGPPTDDTLIPITQTAEGIPVVSVGSTQVQFPLAAPETGFLAAYGDNAAAAAAAEHALSEGYKTAYLLKSPDIGSYSLVTPEYFGEAFEEGGGSVVGEDNYSAGLSDYSSQINEIKGLDEQPDVIFVAMVVPDIGVFARQLQAAGLDIPVYGTDGFDDPALIDVGGDAAESVTFATHGFPEEGSALKEFYDDCTERGYKVENIFFGLAGDAVDVLRTAIEDADSTESAEMIAAINEIEGMQGVTSDSITFKDRDGIPLKRMAIVTVRNGEFVKIADILPEFVPDPET